MQQLSLPVSVTLNDVIFSIAICIVTYFGRVIYRLANTISEDTTGEQRLKPMAIDGS